MPILHFHSSGYYTHTQNFIRILSSSSSSSSSSHPHLFRSLGTIASVKSTLSMKGIILKLILLPLPSSTFIFINPLLTITLAHVVIHLFIFICIVLFFLSFLYVGDSFVHFDNFNIETVQSPLKLHLIFIGKFYFLYVHLLNCA